MIREFEGGFRDTAIHADAVYGLADFQRRTSLGEGGLRSARRRGLQVRYCHSRAFIMGRDFLQYVSEQESTAPGPKIGDTPQCVQQQLELQLPNEG